MRTNIQILELKGKTHFSDLNKEEKKFLDVVKIKNFRYSNLLIKSLNKSRTNSPLLPEKQKNYITVPKIHNYNKVSKNSNRSNLRLSEFPKPTDQGNKKSRIITLPKFYLLGKHVFSCAKNERKTIKISASSYCKNYKLSIKHRGNQ